MPYTKWVENTKYFLKRLLCSNYGKDRAEQRMHCCEQTLAKGSERAKLRATAMSERSADAGM